MCEMMRQGRNETTRSRGTLGLGGGLISHYVFVQQVPEVDRALKPTFIQGSRSGVGCRGAGEETRLACLLLPHKVALPRTGTDILTSLQLDSSIAVLRWGRGVQHPGCPPCCRAAVDGQINGQKISGRGQGLVRKRRSGHIRTLAGGMGENEAEPAAAVSPLTYPQLYLRIHMASNTFLMLSKGYINRKALRGGSWVKESALAGGRHLCFFVP